LRGFAGEEPEPDTLHASANQIPPGDAHSSV
jgi:hypothetical protein